METAASNISYTDKKRNWWLLALSYPLMPFLGIYLHYITGNELMLLIPIAIGYIVIPLADHISGEDETNPPEEIVPILEKDAYYRRLLHFTVPLHFVGFITCAWWVMTQDLTIMGYIIMAIMAGLSSGLGLNTGHELGHKSDAFDKLMAAIVLAVPGYGHFTSEHNAGHHTDVATPEDSASSKMGESIYHFAFREISGGIKRGWRLEKQRLKGKGLKLWGLDNKILLSYSITLLMQGTIVVIGGLVMIPFLIIHNIFAWLQLTSANYIEHYGLLREKKANGQYESCKPHHSWNSNHVISNLVLYYLERHSDHHAYPHRHFQSLRHFDDLPTLPNGYFGCYLLAYVPWLWYKIMDPKLVNLKHIQGDFSKINCLPSKREALEKKYAKRNI